MSSYSKYLVFSLYFVWFTFVLTLILSLFFLNYSAFDLSFDFLFSGVFYIVTITSAFSYICFWGAWIGLYRYERRIVMKRGVEIISFQLLNIII